LDGRCTTCHINNLFEEHLSNTKTQTKTLTCDTCHSNTRSEVKEAIATGNKHCAACHQQGHNMSFSEPVPSDIPLYSGFRWSVSLNAGLWAGESWADEFSTGGKLLISNRRTDVTGDEVWNFYRTEMSANGWTLASDAPAAGSNFYSVTFTKGTRKAITWFYGGETHSASSPPVPSGYRIEILYK
jgi:transcription elongation factor Elf1